MVYKTKRRGTRKRGTRKRGTRKRGTRKRGVNYSSGEGMLVSVWGPALWHVIHVMSFNYPTSPTKKDKKIYKDFIYNLQGVLPCIYCRNNLKKNLKVSPLTARDLVNRGAFSRWIYKLHETINNMLGKKSGLSYCDVRDRYEHFRSRCTPDKNGNSSTKEIKKHATKTKDNDEKGCTESLHGIKSKCIIKIVPEGIKSKSFQIDNRCNYTNPAKVFK
jgi:hypothetical protein